MEDNERTWHAQHVGSGLKVLMVLASAAVIVDCL